MIQMSIRNWLLLALCGVLDAIVSAVYFSNAGQGFHAARTVVFLGAFTLAGGACAIAAALWNRGRGKYWLLVLHGLACAALGLIFAFWKGPLAFRTVALLIVVMAVSIGIYELASPRTFLFGAAGAVSLGFALVFLAFVLGLIKLEPASPGQTLTWMGSYFGVCAITMLFQAVRYS